MNKSTHSARFSLRYKTLMLIFLAAFAFSGRGLAQYCQSVWALPSCGNGISDDYVNGFSMNNINLQGIGCPPTDPNYIDLTTTTCVTVCPGSSYTVTVTPGYSTGSDEY